jgi:membrane protein YdbS with pleckstrin-like domain
MPRTTSVATAALRAIPCTFLIVTAPTDGANARRTSGSRGEAAMMTRERERIHLDSRRHGIVLLPALVRAFVAAAAGGFLVSLAWPFAIAGAALVVAAALYALRAVWRWERTHVIVTDEQLALVRGTLRRRVAAVRLERVGAVEVEQGPLGRLLGYGTLIAGPLEITYVPQPRSVYGLVDSLSP